ncbi:MAG: glycosyltransferase family 2 protein [Prevotellaceae bacterium]|jgi:glycosyltransferase involved in cell wall biosynthesis|nr:glycosyltransferase family 2 protein [Prevotellaceae bacterium]
MMETTPLFSVLIANYNNGKYISSAINSVIAQTYTNWEIIIVDDCSADNSLRIIEQYKNHDNIKIAKNDKNKGCGYTKRRCAELAGGLLCGFLDSDDELLPNALEVMVQAHIQHPECSLIGSRSYRCNANLQPYGVTKYKMIPKGQSYLTFDCHAPYHYATFKKQLYDKTEGISANVTHAVDQDLYFKLDEVGQVLFLNKILYKYRVHNNGISNSSNSFGKALFWHIILICEAYKRRGLQGADQHATRIIIAHPYRSWKYRFGNFCLTPIILFIRIINIIRFYLFANGK